MHKKSNDSMEENTVNRKALSFIVAIAVLFLSLPALAADADLLRAKVIEGIVGTYTAVANESATTTNHAERISVMTNARDNLDTWADRIILFIKDNAPTLLDGCTGDANGTLGVTLNCTNSATQAAVDTQIAAWLSTEVNAKVGAP